MAKDKKDTGDPIERAMRKREEAEAKAKAAAANPPAAESAPLPFSAPKREPSRAKTSRTFYEPLPTNKYEPSLYEPDEGSFFAPSADERAEQARRAAQRVRRRAKGEPVDPQPQAAPAPTPAPTVKPVPPQAAPTPPAPPVAKQPAAPDPAPAAKPPAADLISRSAEARSKPAPAAAPAPKVETTPKQPTSDLVTRIAQAQPKPQPQPEPAPKVDAPIIDAPKTAAAATAASLIERASSPRAKPKATATVNAPREPKVSRPKPAQRTRTAKAAAPTAAPAAFKASPRASRPARQTAATAQPVSPRVEDTFESVYADTPEAPLEHPSFKAQPPIRNAKTKAFAPFEWMIASRYLRARKKEGFVSVITGFSLVGIALGVATLIVVMAVMTGFRETLITQIIGGSPHINVQAQTDRFETFDTVAQNIRGVPGVTYVTPVVQGQVLGTGRRGHSGVVVRGMRKADLEHLITSANPQVTNGSLADFEDDRGVAVGANLAAKLGLRVGDFISLISPDGDITPFQATPMPRKKDYKIIYTFKLGVQQIDYNMAFMPFEEAQIYFNKQGVADTLDVFVNDAQNVEQFSDPIFQSARSSISLYNWKTQNGSLIGAINLERQVMFVILTMIILVAALNIISGLVMLVKDKSRDVAIMRTMGMARGSILRIFFICGSSIGVVGSVLGVVLGVLFVWNIKSVQTFVEWATGTTVWDPAVRAGMTEIPTNMQFGDVALTLFIALSLSFLATLYPAWKAAKLDPVEALRYE